MQLFNCSRCGPWQIDRSGINDFYILRYSKKQISRIIYGIWNQRVKLNDIDEIPDVSPEFRKNELNNFTISIDERINTLFGYICLKSTEPGRIISEDIQRLCDVTHSDIEESVYWFLNYLQESGYISPHNINNTIIPNRIELGLTYSGYKYYFEIQSGKSKSNYGFMAMKYHDPELDRIFYDFFKPGCAKLGLDLKTLIDEPAAGLIDNRLRVMILQSKFLIADLTHKNPGAYWEAGFAEGSGKPVIYSCRADLFHEAHFDTNHHHTILWNPSQPEEAERKLIDTLRITFSIFE
ncbi:MAG: hypothetical protein HUU10_15490 [Bacteroidetes bacterium]|nr:hypothetical protein [Bacteroidota bacterium]